MDQLLSPLYEFFDAWKIWWGAKLLDTYVLWGTQIFWWGRIGKALQAFGLVGTILELIGSQKINAWGQRLKTHLSKDNAKRQWTNALQFTRTFYEAVYVAGRAHRLANLSKEHPISYTIFTGVAYGGSIYVIYRLWGVLEHWYFIVTAFIFTLGLMGFVASAVVLLGTALLVLIGALVYWGIAKWIAWIMSRENLNNYVKLLVLGCAVVGTIFAVLAS